MANKAASDFVIFFFWFVGEVRRCIVCIVDVAFNGGEERESYKDGKWLFFRASEMPVNVARVSHVLLLYISK